MVRPACFCGPADLQYWQSRIIAIVPSEAPGPLVEVMHWAQQHRDALEYVELLCAFEEIAEAIQGERGALSSMQERPV